ncbi:phage head-tail connector protein [Weissella muntiaci]|uniref:Phage head-tail connector protein n=1 Tax=Weissella muntiaci TaxID=2508881 RepID=A0A6C2C7H6_9LACO|nr:phage head-tail connector protein [Weissella muntiaci]TYC49612.1 phage head-tail connector protein [Weissella muntiaci]
MDDLAKVKLLLGIGDTLQDKLLNFLIDDSKERLVSYINQDGAYNISFPNDLGWILRELTVRRFNRIGDEGKQSSSESDVSITWREDDIADYALYLDKYRQKNGGRGIARFI